MHQHLVTTRLGICLAIICGVVGRPMVAQDTAGRTRAAAGRESAFGAIDGTVVDTTGASLPLVEVLMLDSPYPRGRTNSGGAVRLDSVAAGLHMLRAHN